LELRRPRLDARRVAVLVAPLLALAVAVPPRTSHDLWAYAMYGRVVTAHHANPYLQAPDRFPHDPVLQRVDRGWRATPSAYGPGFTALSAAVALVVRDRALPTRLAYQGLAALAIASMIVALARRRTAA